jgi:hypothetical protein
MRRTLTVLSTVAVLAGTGAATASAASVNFETGSGTATPPAQLGPYAMMPTAVDPRPDAAVVTSASTALGTIQFGLPVTHYTSDPLSWPSWGGAPGDIYFTGFLQSSMTMTLPPGTSAIDFYGQNTASGTFQMTALNNGKVIGRVNTTWPDGAKYMGFWVPLTQEIDQLQITEPNDAFGFGIGSIRVARGTERGPMVDSLSQSSGSSAGGDTITIRGQNFTDGTGVLFGGVPANSVTLVNYSTLRVVTPPHAAGAVDVKIVNRNGTSPQVDADAFTFVG